MEISDNKLVKINYNGTLTDGSVFDSSEGREPLEFIFGVGMIIPGLEEGLLGLKKGDKKKITVTAENAYGPVMAEAVQDVPRDQFPAEMELEIGMQLAAQGPHGVIPVRIAEIKETSVLVDFNHPLAGKDLTFDVDIVEVSELKEEDKARILGPLGGCSSGSCSDCSTSSGCSH